MAFLELEHYPLHQGAVLNQLELIQQALQSGAKNQLNEYCPKGLTPLHYAATYQHTEIVQYLLEAGADPFLTDNRFFNNVVHMAQKEGQHTTLSQYLKNHIGLTEETLRIISKHFQKVFQKAIQNAKKENKKILILLGEDHGQYRIYQIEKVLLKLAQTVGIHVLYSESNPSGSHFSAIDYFALEELNMSVEGIDTHPFRLDDSQCATLEERNAYMAKEIHQRNQNAILIVGCQHLYGLIEEEDSKIDTTQFHLLPINLSCLYSKFPQEQWKESIYAYDPLKVMQIDEAIS